MDEGIRFWDEEVASHLSSFLYVDDTTLFDKVPLERATRHFTTATTEEHFPDISLSRDFEELSNRAGEIGMVINQKKTQLLVISAPNGCNTSASFTSGAGVEVKSVDKMRLVGFTLGRRSTCRATSLLLPTPINRKNGCFIIYEMPGSRGCNSTVYIAAISDQPSSIARWPTIHSSLRGRHRPLRESKGMPSECALDMVLRWRRSCPPTPFQPLRRGG